MNKDGVIGIAIYLACDKMKKTEKKKRRPFGMGACVGEQ